MKEMVNLDSILETISRIKEAICSDMFPSLPDPIQKAHLNTLADIYRIMIEAVKGEERSERFYYGELARIEFEIERFGIETLSESYGKGLCTPFVCDFIPDMEPLLKQYKKVIDLGCGYKEPKLETFCKKRNITYIGVDPFVTEKMRPGTIQEDMLSFIRKQSYEKKTVYVLSGIDDIIIPNTGYNIEVAIALQSHNVIFVQTHPYHTLLELLQLARKPKEVIVEQIFHFKS